MKHLSTGAGCDADARRRIYLSIQRSAGTLPAKHHQASPPWATAGNCWLSHAADASASFACQAGTRACCGLSLRCCPAVCLPHPSTWPLAEPADAPTDPPTAAALAAPPSDAPSIPAPVPMCAIVAKAPVGAFARRAATRIASAAISAAESTLASARACMHSDADHGILIANCTKRKSSVEPIRSVSQAICSKRAQHRDCICGRAAREQQGLRTARRISTSASSSRRRRPSSAASTSGVTRRLGRAAAAPRDSRASALTLWWSSATVGDGSRSAALPGVGQRAGGRRTAVAEISTEAEQPLNAVYGLASGCARSTRRTVEMQRFRRTGCHELAACDCARPRHHQV